jgi:hypothetical protein
MTSLNPVIGSNQIEEAIRRGSATNACPATDPGVAAPVEVPNLSAALARIPSSSGHAAMTAVAMSPTDRRLSPRTADDSA